jgi:hypothetical protein
VHSVPLSQLDAQIAVQAPFWQAPKLLVKPPVKPLVIMVQEVPSGRLLSTQAPLTSQLAVWQLSVAAQLEHCWALGVSGS